jgi:hypothetical protein
LGTYTSDDDGDDFVEVVNLSKGLRRFKRNKFRVDLIGI